MEDHANDFDETVSNSSLLTVQFNQDGGCLAIGTTSGFSVHDLYPQYGVSVNRELNGGIGLVEMLFRCSLMAVVGGGPSPYSPPHRVLIHDDNVGKAIGDLCFRQVVHAVKLRKDSIAVALRDRVYVYHLADLSLRDKIYTADNPHGLLCLSTQIQDMVLACPSVTPGHVRVELYGLRKTVLMEAHESALRALALTSDGSRLATASEKGTVLRVFDVASAVCLHELRRGVERAKITCLSWSWDGAWLCCTSDKGTAHIFHVEGDSSAEKKGSESLTSMFFSTMRKSVEGDAKKSVCQVRGVPHPKACAFVAAAKNLIAVAGWDADGNGVILLSEFKAGEEPKRVGYHVLCKSAKVDESEEARRRRRLRGWTPEIPETPEGGKFYVGERLETLEKGMEQIQFDEGQDEDEFVSVSTVQLPKHEDLADNPEAEKNSSPGTSEVTDDARQSNVADSGIGDSVRTEPLDDEHESDSTE